MNAGSATLLKDEDKAVLIDVSIFFFTKDNKKVHLTSKKGILHTKMHDMTFPMNSTIEVSFCASILSDST